MLGEQRATPENLARMVQELMTNAAERRRLAGALAEWHQPNAARIIAEAILKKNSRWKLKLMTSAPTPELYREGRDEPAVLVK